MLVVPALRVIVVFLNVYETFKTLKPPPPSVRRGGQPSVRAISQRKRDLKGCLAVWVVWCCYAVYERTFDRIVGIFLPFYNEIKAIFLLFLALTRSKGAEPLFLHVLRPFLKPYATVVDPMLEFSRDVGDFIFALLQTPLDYILSSPWFAFSHSGELEEEYCNLSSNARITSADPGTRASHSNIPISVDHPVSVRTSRVQNALHEPVRSVVPNCSSDLPSVANFYDSRNFRDRHLKSAPTTSLPVYGEHPPHDPPRYSQSLSSCNGKPVYPASSQNAPITVLDLPGNAPEYHSPEWRTYPAFPSAYPPTPLPSLASLPSSAIRRSGNARRVVSDSAYPPVPEDEQGSGVLLYPGSVYSSSNSDKIPPRVNSCEPSHDAARQPDEATLVDDSMCSSEAGLSEDGFGASLRTPHRSPEAILSGPFSSVESLTSALTNTDNAYSLRTKKSSDSSSSGSSSLAGRKRTHGAVQKQIRNAFPTSKSRNSTLHGRHGVHSRLQDPLRSSPSEGEDESGLDDDDDGTKAKRQRVFDSSKRKSTVPVAAMERCGTRKALPSRSATARSRSVATASQATLRNRAGSAATNNSTIKGRRPALVSRQVMRGGSQGFTKTSSTSSSQSGSLEGRVS